MYNSVHYCDLIAIGFALVELNRTREGLEQCAIALEICPFDERPIALVLVGWICERIYRYDLTIKLFQEAFVHAAKITTSRTNSKYFSNDFMDFCERRYFFSISAQTDEDIGEYSKIIEENSLSISDEINNYLITETFLDNKKLKLNTVFNGNKFSLILISKIEEIKRTAKGSEIRLSDDFDKIVNAIFDFFNELFPFEAYAYFLPVSTQLKKLLYHFCGKFPEIEETSDPKSNAKILLKIEKNSKTKFMKLWNIIYKVKYIKSFLCFIEGKFEESTIHSKWIYILYNSVKNGLKQKMDFKKTDYLKSIQEIMPKKLEISLYTLLGLGIMNCSLSLQKYDNLSIIVNDIQNMLDSDKESKFRNPLYYEVITKMLKRIAMLKGESIIHENYTYILLDKNALKVMISADIVASCLKFDDDSTVIENYERILWGLLLCGDVHVKTIWFFSFLRQYYIKKFQVFPLNLSHKSILDDYSLKEDPVVWNMIENIYSLRNSFTTEENKESWSNDKASAFLTSCFVVKLGKYDKINEVHTFHEFEEESKRKRIFMAAQRSFKDMKHFKHNNDLQTNLETSMNWITFWKDNYEKRPLSKKSNTKSFATSSNIPKPISNFLLICLN